MAEINAKDLTAKTSPASTDSMLLFGTTSNEGAKITVDNLADNILGRLTTKTFANQVGGSSAATILAQLATLNSNTSLPINVEAYQLTADMIELYDCTGTISKLPIYGVSGNRISVSGRLVITDVVRTGDRPGIRFKLPNGKTLKSAVNLANIGGMVQWGLTVKGRESVYVTSITNSDNIIIGTSETYENFSGNRLELLIPYTVFAVK